MKNKKKKSNKNKKIKKKKPSRKLIKRSKKVKTKTKKFSKTKFKKIKKSKKKKIKSNKYSFKIKKIQKESIILKLVKLQLSLKPQLNFKINFSLEKHIQGFFDKISETISSYKILKKTKKEDKK